MTAPDDFRAGVRAALKARLISGGGDTFTVLGAGSDDLEAGRAYLRALADGGWAVPTWPAEYGGLGATPAQAGVVAQELARFDVPDLYPYLIGLAIAGPTLVAHATPEQCSRWLPAIRTGDDIWCQLFSEPDAGSDLASLATRAERDGDQWRITGSKVWTSRAHYSQRGLLLARTDPSVPKHAGITAFALDLLGPDGIAGEDGDGEWQTLFLTSPSISIRGGTDEIQRNIVGERVLGLPPEPRADVNVPFSELPRTVRRAEQ